MRERNWAKRLLVFCVGTLIYGFSVGLMAAPDVGVSPISSIAYALTFIVPGATLGMTQLLVNTLMVLVQIAWLRREFEPAQLLQLPASLMFSVVIDCTRPLVACIMGLGSGLIFRGLVFLCSLPVMALGLSLMIRADLVVMPGDGLAKVLAAKTGWPFGQAKVRTDCACVALTCVLSLIFLRRIVGIQLGTVIAALVLGRLVKVISKMLNR